MDGNSNKLSRRRVLKSGALATGALVLGGTAATGTVAAGIGDGRVGHYNLNNLHLNKDTDEKIKNFVHDASPAKNHGTNYGAEVAKDGAVGKAFQFDGTSEVVVSSDSTLNPSNEVTVAGWVKATGDTSADYDNKGVAGKWNSGRGGAQYVLWTNTGSELEYTFSVTTADGRADAKAAPIQDDSWHHVAGVFDGTASIYIDGQKTTGSSASGDINSSDVPFKLGNYATGHEFAGLIDEARIYDRTLSSTEVTELYEMKD